MVKSYKEISQDALGRTNETKWYRKYRKTLLFALIAIILALLGYSVAQNALSIAQINNIIEIQVNNTNLAPSAAGHPPGTGERVTGGLYWTNSSAIELFVWAHAMSAGETAEIHLFINGTKVSDTSGRPIGSAEQSNKTIVAMIPKGVNYSVEFFNTHHYEWREYPVLAGKNGTLSINQTVTAELSSVNSSLNYLNNSKVNKSGDTMTGSLNATYGINTTAINITNKLIVGNPNLSVLGGAGLAIVGGSGVAGQFQRDSSSATPVSGMGVNNLDVTNKNAIAFTFNSLFSGSLGQGAGVGAKFNDHTDASKTSLLLTVNAVAQAEVNNSNMTVLNPGKGYIMMSQDGTKCGFIYWGNDDTLHSNSISC